MSWILSVSSCCRGSALRFDGITDCRCGIKLNDAVEPQRHGGTEETVRLGWSSVPRCLCGENIWEAFSFLPAEGGEVGDEVVEFGCGEHGPVGGHGGRVAIFVKFAELGFEDGVDAAGGVAELE